MAAFKDIKIALDSYLDSMGSDVIAWEGVRFSPMSAGLYLRPTVLPAVSNVAALNRTQEHNGIYQIDIIADRDTDIDTIFDKADEIRQHFLAVDSLTENTTSIFLRSITQLVLDDDEAYLYLPVQITWSSYSL